MRVITVTVIMIAILAIGGLTLRHMPSAVARPEQAQIDPHALPTIVNKTLPNTPGDLLGGPPYP